jgi:hypothetical protein
MTERAGGTHVYNFAPHEQYWKKKRPTAQAPVTQALATQPPAVQAPAARAPAAQAPAAQAPASPVPAALRSEHPADGAFVPRYPATAYSESASYRRPSDPYAVGAITRPTPEQDLGGKTYGAYQFESSVYRDGTHAPEGAPAKSTVMRFVRDGSNPYGAELSEVVKKHGVASAEFDAKWRELTARDNRAFGLAQERFMEAELRTRVQDWMDTAGVSEEARKDPRLFDIVVGTLNQYGELAPAHARQVRATGAKTADEVGAALQQSKQERVGSNFKSSPKAHAGIYARIEREGSMFQGYRPRR